MCGKITSSFRCKFRRWHPLAKPDPVLEHPRVVNDDCCMSGLATMKIKSDLEDQHVVYISYENEVRFVKQQKL